MGGAKGGPDGPPVPRRCPKQPGHGAIYHRHLPPFLDFRLCKESPSDKWNLEGAKELWTYKVHLDCVSFPRTSVCAGVWRKPGNGGGSVEMLSAAASTPGRVCTRLKMAFKTVTLSCHAVAPQLTGISMVRIRPGSKPSLTVRRARKLLKVSPALTSKTNATAHSLTMSALLVSRRPLLPVPPFSPWLSDSLRLDLTPAAPAPIQTRFPRQQTKPKRRAAPDR